jgi:hypothetical protein
MLFISFSLSPLECSKVAQLYGREIGTAKLFINCKLCMVFLALISFINYYA